jgi:hypothetical protein
MGLVTRAAQTALVAFAHTRLVAALARRTHARDASRLAREARKVFPFFEWPRVQLSADGKMFARGDGLFIAVPLTPIHHKLELHVRLSSKAQAHSELILG